MLRILGNCKLKSQEPNMLTDVCVFICPPSVSICRLTFLAMFATCLFAICVCPLETQSCFLCFVCVCLGNKLKCFALKLPSIVLHSQIGYYAGCSRLRELLPLWCLGPTINRALSLIMSTYYVTSLFEIIWLASSINDLFSLLCRYVLIVNIEYITRCFRLLKFCFISNSWIAFKLIIFLHRFPINKILTLLNVCIAPSIDISLSYFMVLFCVFVFSQ